MKYRQCTLHKKVGTTTKIQVSWIPIFYAIINNVIRLSDGKKWDDGWVVVGLGDTKEESDLPDPKANFKKHKRMTGDSLPRECSYREAIDVWIEQRLLVPAPNHEPQE